MDEKEKTVVEWFNSQGSVDEALVTCPCGCNYNFKVMVVALIPKELEKTK